MTLSLTKEPDDINPKKYQKMKHFNHLLKLLDTFCKEYNIPKKDIIIFGSSVLARNGIRDVKDLDICIPDLVFNKISNNKELKFETKVASCECTLTKDTLSFISTKCIPIPYKDLNSSTIKVQGFKMISKETWIKMQKKDPDAKDRKYIDSVRLLK